MERIADLGLALVLVGLAVACGRSDPPRLEVTPLPGSAQAGVLDVRYRLRNAGGRTLALDGLAPACGCVATSRLPATLTPGATSMLAVRCRPSGTGGDVVRELRLYTSDPGSPEGVLRVTLPELGGGAGPGLYFGYVPVGESAVHDLALPATVSFEDLPAPVRPELAIEPMPGSGGGVRVRFTPRLPGVVRTTIALGPAGGVLPVVAIGYDGVLAYPAEVSLSDAVGRAGPRTVTLLGLEDEPLEIAHVDYPPGISGELRTLVPGRQFRLLLRGSVRDGASVPAAIRLRRAAAGDPILTVPVVGPAGGS